MHASLAELGARAVVASRILATVDGSARDAALDAAADVLVSHTESVLEANRRDLDAASAAGAPPAVVDRLTLSPSRIEAMAGGLRTVAALDDPLGEVVRGWVRPDGLEIRQVRAPLGVVGIIYENRPNVTSDAAGLCLKAGSAAFLRGSSTAIHSNQAVAAAIRAGYTKAGVPEDALVLVEDTTRESAVEFMRLRGVIDCLVPRGGPSLIDAVLAHATVPTVIDGAGNCHVYVDASADLDMALAIVANGKTQRPSVCNATESLLVHRAVAGDFLPRLADELPQVVLRADARALGHLPTGRASEATEEDFATEYLDLALSVAVVDDLEDAIAHIARYGSGHTEAIVTADLASARAFQRRVDAAAVVVNASTRFTDGEEYGFGAEIGISTQKLHARGPMGVRELTTTKYLVTGSGHVRR